MFIKTKSDKMLIFLFFPKNSFYLFNEDYTLIKVMIYKRNMFVHYIIKVKTDMRK